MNEKFDFTQHICYTYNTTTSPQPTQSVETLMRYMRYMLSAALILSSTTALAVNIGPTQNNDQKQNQNQNQHQLQQQVQGQAQSQGQWSSNHNSNTNRNYNSNSNRNSLKQNNSQANQQVHNEYNPRNSGIAPSLGIGAFASGHCIGTTQQAGASVGLPGGVSVGVVGGTSNIDLECTRRETARMLNALGDNATALRLMHAAPIVVELNKAEAAATAARAATTSPAATNNNKHPACASRWASAETRKALACD